MCVSLCVRAVRVFICKDALPRGSFLSSVTLSALPPALGPEEPGPTSQASLLHPGVRLHANVNTMLKYAYAVSGQEPVTRRHILGLPMAQKSLEPGGGRELPGPSRDQPVTATSATSPSAVRASTETERATGQHVQRSIQQLLSSALSLEGSLQTETTQLPPAPAPEMKGSSRSAQEGMPDTSAGGR